MSDKNEFGDADYPTGWRDADERSQKGRKWYLGLIYIELLLACAVALASDLFEPLNPYSKRLALVVVVSLVSMMVVQLVRMKTDHDATWFGERAFAESLKTMTWRYMMKAEPFGDQEKADEQWHSSVARLKEFANKHNKGEKITHRMAEVRKLRWPVHRELYIVARLDDQIRWYENKFKYNSCRAKICLGFSFIAEVLAVVIAAGLLLKVLGRWSPPCWWLNLVPWLTTVAASIIAWSQAKRFDELKESYRIAHKELVQIKERVILAEAEARFIEGVMNGENAISREHTMWAAKSASPLLWRPRS